MLSGALGVRIRVFLLRTVRMLLIIILLIVFVSYFVFVVVPGLLHLLLHVRRENWIFCQNLLFGHLKALKQQVCLSLRDLVLVFLG